MGYAIEEKDFNHGWTSILRSRATAEDGRMDTDGESRNPIVLVVVLVLVIEAREIEDENENENEDENLRRQPAEAKRGAFPGSAGVSPACREPKTGTRRRDAGAPRRFMANRLQLSVIVL
jgi:hypothetical protein